MATSGLVFAIHSLDFTKPEKTRGQYGSPVCLLSIAAPMAGTCDDATPAMILATFRPRLAATLRSGFGFDGFGFGGFRLCRFRLYRFRRRLVAPRLAAVAFDRAAAAQHHLGIVVLRGARHSGGKVAEPMAVGGAGLGGEIDVSPKLAQTVVFAGGGGGGPFRAGGG